MGEAIFSRAGVFVGVAVESVRAGRDTGGKIEGQLHAGFIGTAVAIAGAFRGSALTEQASFTGLVCGICVAGGLAKVILWTIRRIVDVGAARGAEELKTGISTLALAALITGEPGNNREVIGAGILETALTRATVAVGQTWNLRRENIA